MLLKPRFSKSLSVKLVKTETPTDISYTGGWIFSQGYIWKVNSLPNEAKQGGFSIFFIFKEDNSYPPVTYQSGSSNQVHIERVVDIVYQNTLPSGTIHVDYTAPIYVYEDRIEDLIVNIAANTASRVGLDTAWTELDGTAIAGLVYSGGSFSIASSSRLSYKIVGSILHLQLSLILNSPSPSSFSIKFPSFTGVQIKDAIHPSILALDTFDTQQPCAVDFSAEVVTPSPIPALMTFTRSHADTTTNTVSFMATLEVEDV